MLRSLSTQNGQYRQCCSDHQRGIPIDLTPDAHQECDIGADTHCNIGNWGISTSPVHIAENASIVPAWVWRIDGQWLDDLKMSTLLTRHLRLSKKACSRISSISPHNGWSYPTVHLVIFPGVGRIRQLKVSIVTFDQVLLNRSRLEELDLSAVDESVCQRWLNFALLVSRVAPTEHADSKVITYNASVWIDCRKPWFFLDILKYVDSVETVWQPVHPSQYSEPGRVCWQISTQVLRAL